MEPRHGEEVYLILQNLPWFFFFFFMSHHSTWKILVPQPGMESACPAVEVWSLNHRTPGKSSSMIHTSVSQMGMLRLRKSLRVCRWKNRAMNRIHLTPETALPTRPHRILGKQATQPQWSQPIPHASPGSSLWFLILKAPTSKNLERPPPSSQQNSSDIYYTFGIESFWCPGTSLVIQWLRLHLPMQGVQIWSLVRALRSHVTCCQK